MSLWLFVNWTIKHSVDNRQTTQNSNFHHYYDRLNYIMHNSKNVTLKSQLRSRWKIGRTNAYPGFSHTHRSSLILSFDVLRRGGRCPVQSSLGQIGKVDHSSMHILLLFNVFMQNVCNTNSRNLTAKWEIYFHRYSSPGPAPGQLLRLWSVDCGPIQVTA